MKYPSLKRIPRLIVIGLITFIGFIIFIFLLSILFLLLEEPILALYLTLALFILFILSYLVYRWMKIYKSNKQLWFGILVLAVVIGLNGYFYYLAYRTEMRHQSIWSQMPELSTMYTSMAYIKALVKIVIVDGLALISWLWLGTKKK